MDLVFVTHGSTDSPVDMCVGQSDIALSGAGFAAIQELASSWIGPPPRFLFGNDLHRCQQSAQIFAARFAIEPLWDPRLREMDFGDWQGQRWKNISQQDRDRYQRWLHNPIIQPAPGGESFTDLLHRSGAWLASVLASTSRRDVVLTIAHASTLRALLCHSLGLTPARAESIAATPARASMIRCQDGQFEVCYLNTSTFQQDQATS